MASNTENLDLLMKNPSTDGADTFNVQTMLNENWQKIDNNAGTVAQTLANILKPTTPPIIGLPPSTTPDGMFQALGNTGELHVWRKTVVSKTPGYNLSVAQKNYLSSGSNYGSGNSRVTFTVSASVSVANDGTVTQNNPSSETYIYHQDVVSNVQNQIRGKFVSITTDHSSGYYSEPQDGIWFVPADANITLVENGTSLGYPYNYCYVADKMQKVTGYAQGTTTTYPVSTNPNAYQEGNDAKPAGYTLGEVVMGKFRMGDLAPSNAYEYEYADGVTVDENGTVSLQNPSKFSINSNSNQGYESTIFPLISGKFLRYKGRNSSYGGSDAPDTQHPFDATPSVIVYIPADVVVTSTSTWPAGFYIDRYQPVTGYAAIPAGTAIEYLGKLGDKTRIQVVSYVGTGTYGADNPCSLTFDFAPKVVMFIDYVYTDGTNRGNHYIDNSSNIYYEMSRLSTEKLTGSYTQNNGLGGYGPQLYGKKTNGGKTITWYSQSGSDYQANSAGYIYTYLGIG